MASSSSSSSSSSSLPPAMEVGGYRNWADLPPELTASILHRLGAFEILRSAQKVCRSWRSVCKDPSMWREIDMINPGDVEVMKFDIESMCEHAVDRSEGGLVEIDLWYFGNGDLLNYIADRSSNLRILRIKRSSCIRYDGFVEAIVKLPLLEELEVSLCSLSGKFLKVVGQSCPNLKTLKFNMHPQRENDDDALAIAETMPGLRHLQIFGNGLSDTGLKAILDNCPNLEHLDLRRCLNVYLVGDMKKRCSESVKVVRHPGDSTHDYQFDASFIYVLSSDDDEYPYAFSDVDLMSGDEYDEFYDLLSAWDNSDNDQFNYYDDMFL